MLEKFKQHFHQAVEEIKKYSFLCKLPLVEVISVYSEIIQDAACTVTVLLPTQVSLERLFCSENKR